MPRRQFEVKICEALEHEKKCGYYFLIIYICLIIFTPYISIGGRNNFEITFPITLLFAAFLPCAYRRYRHAENTILNHMLEIMTAIFIAYTLSIINYIRVSRGVSNIISNSVPNVKVALYILIIAGIYSIDFDLPKLKHFIHYVMPSIGAVISVIGIFQRFNIFNINAWFTKYYIPTESGKVLIEVLNNADWSRVLGTLSNPNFYSLELIIFMIFTVSNVMFMDGIRGKLMNTIVSLMLFAATIFTQSRTALAVVFGMCIYVLIIQGIKRGRKMACAYALIAIAVIGVSLLLIKSMNLNYFLEFVRDGLKTRSITQRIQRWNDAIKLFKLHPVIGIGPVIGKYFSAVDNEYVQMLRNYGVVGMLTYLSFYLYIFVKTIKCFLGQKHIIANQYAFGVNCSTLAIMATNVTSAAFLHWRNFTLFLILCCIFAKAQEADKSVSLK